MKKHRVQLQYRVVYAPDSSAFEENFAFFYFHGGGVILTKVTDRSSDYAPFVKVSKFDTKRELLESLGIKFRGRLRDLWIERSEVSSGDLDR